MKSKIKILSNTIFLGIFFVSNFAQAQLVQCGTKADATACEIGDLVSGVFIIINFLVGSATLLAIGYLLFAGVRMILAVGNEGQIKEAKTTITNALTGLIIVLMGYLIIASVVKYFTGWSLEELRTNFFHF